MFRIGFEQFFIIFNLTLLILLLLFWGRKSWREVNREWNLSQESLCRCSKCHLIFLAHRGVSAASCPSCHEMIKIRLKKAAKRFRY